MVPDLAQNGMALPRFGTLARWVGDATTECNKAYGVTTAAFIKAGGTYPYNEPGFEGDIIAQDRFVKIAHRKLKQYQWMFREGHFLEETPKDPHTRSLSNKPKASGQKKRKAPALQCSAIPPWPRPMDAPPRAVLLDRPAPNRNNNDNAIGSPAAIFNAAPHGTFPAPAGLERPIKSFKAGAPAYQFLVLNTSKARMNNNQRNKRNSNSAPACGSSGTRAQQQQHLRDRRHV
jgi:hypothetical protein